MRTLWSIRPSAARGSPHACGDSSKAREKLGWTCGLSFEDLIREMVQADLEHYGRGAQTPNTGSGRQSASWDRCPTESACRHGRLA